MRYPLRAIAVCAILLQLGALPAQAVGYASIRWETCPTPPGTDTQNRYHPASATDIATVTLEGISGVVREVSFDLVLWAGGSQVPEAWRYDPNGCSVVHVGLPLSSSCTPMTGSNRLQVTRVDYESNDVWSWSKAVETVHYEAGFDGFAATPLTEYVVAQVAFDHFNGAGESCDCLERPLCIGLKAFRYRDANGVEHSTNTYSEGIRWNDPGNQLLCPSGPDLCMPECVWEADTLCVSVTPATQRSWGNIKASYR